MIHVELRQYNRLLPEPGASETWPGGTAQMHHSRVDEDRVDQVIARGLLRGLRHEKHISATAGSKLALSVLRRKTGWSVAHGKHI